MLRGGYTLIEVLIVVTVLGIAATMVVPTFSQTSPLRVQAAVRTIVADITQAQSDAVALQVGHGIRFVSDGANTHCILAPVSGTHLDESTDVITRRQIGGEEFGNVTFTDINLPDGILVFDALGGPVESPGSDIPAPTQSVTLSAGSISYRITIEAYTGRVTVAEIAPPRESEEETTEELEGGGTLPTGTP
jgi:prepilin-type N-terminal cleavage/methylation domain-containing protein